jgi:transcriptional regulator with XRE-family HTH domain
MQDEYTPRSVGETSNSALQQLREAIDAASVAETVSPSEAVELDQWIEEIVCSGVLATTPLKPKALDTIVSCLPSASFSDDFIVRVERERKRVQLETLAEQDAERTCNAQTPGDLVRDLRSARQLPLEAAADALHISPDRLSAIEAGAAPWSVICPAYLSTFAELVGISLLRCVALLKVAARRAIRAKIERRASSALGRFDRTQHQRAARRDTLRMAFARVQEENRSAAEFFREADRLVADAFAAKQDSADP